MSRDFDLIEFDLVRLTAQSSGPNPKEPGGGVPEYTRADVLACAAEMPHLAWHCILAKYCGDELSEAELLNRVHRMSVAEWFDNPEHRTKSIQANELIKVAQVAVIGYLMPRSEHATNCHTRGAFVGCSEHRFKRQFQSHYVWLIGEMEYAERIGRLTYRERKKGRG